jgi:hypothetical protein
MYKDYIKHKIGYYNLKPTCYDYNAKYFNIQEERDWLNANITKEDIATDNFCIELDEIMDKIAQKNKWFVS